MIKMIHDRDYATATASGLVVVDFRKDWCPPCRQMDAVLTQLDTQLAGSVTFLTLTINRDPYVAQALGVKSVPTLIFKQAGKIVDAVIGPRSLSDLQQRLIALKA